MKKEERIVCIGMGHLMELIAPCYEEFLGLRLAENMIATKASEAGLEEKRKRFPFPIQLGNNYGALLEMNPTIILFAPPPAKAMDIARADLLPYFEHCRKTGQRLPIIFAFPPMPSADEYLKLLGEDVRVCNVLPNTFTHIGGKQLHNEGLNGVMLPEIGSGWTEEETALVVNFFRPFGQTVFMAAYDALRIMGASCVVNTIVRYCFEMEAQLGISFNLIAAAMRISFRERQNITYGDVVPRRDDLPKWLTNPCGDLINRLYSGLMKSLEEEGVSEVLAEQSMKAMTDIYLHFYMVENRETVESGIAKQMTRGGVVECATKLYQSEMQEALRVATAVLVNEHTFTPDFLDYVEEFGWKSGRIVSEHGARLAQK